MKVLMALEDKSDARPLMDSIRSRTWPSGTVFVFVHVVSYGSSLWENGLLDTSSEELDYEGRAKYRMLMKVAKSIRDSVPGAVTEAYVCYGAPTQEVLKAVNDIHPNVVIVGRHGWTKLRQLFHKSVSEQILLHIPPSVDTVQIVEIPEIQGAALQ